jgi:predicted acetyltransferase
MEPDCPVSLAAVTESSRPALANLFQLYVYDWSELLPLDVRSDGRFPDELFAKYATEDAERHAFLVYADARLAGFAIVAERSRLTGEAGVCDMEEFFVMRRHRGRGLGRAAAVATFDRFPDRRWEVRQRDDNPAATAFWRKVIDGYTAGHYQELRWNDGTWVGPVQTFRRVSPAD